jgi:hypoxanthine phosphoribosyltransferase
MPDLKAQNPSVIVSPEEIQKAVQACVQAVKKHLEPKDKNVVFICVLKGAIYFFNDVIRHFSNSPYEIDFCKLASYEGTSTTGKIDMQLPCRTAVKGKHAVVFEDIVDSGLSLKFLQDYFKSEGVESLMVCTLLQKPDMLKIDVKADFVGINVPNKFLVGYGLDCDERHRLHLDIRELV